MRIVLVQDHLRMGGTERQSVQLANAFAAEGHDVRLITFRPGGPLAPAVSARVSPCVLQPLDCRVCWFAPGMTRAIRAWRPAIVLLMGRVAQILAWRLHRALPDAAIVATFRTGKRIPQLHAITLRAAAAVVANSDEAAARLVRLHRVDATRVHVIRNAVAAPPPVPADARARVRAELGTSADAIVFLCTAMLRPEKGHRDLIETAAGLELAAPWELWIAGDGTARSTCETLAARSTAAAQRIRFLGLRHDVHALYAAADVAVLSSHSESLPNFLVEAQWLGVPVAAWSTAGVGESFAPGLSGWLTPYRDHAALRAAMGRLACDAALRARMSAHAREYAQREFDPVRQNQRYLDLFAQLRVAR